MNRSSHIVGYILKESFVWATKYADIIVSDNIPVKNYFKKGLGRDTEYIVYGTDLPYVKGTNALKKYNLKPEGYFLYIDELISDKGVHILVKAFEKLNTGKKLIIIGDSPYFSQYKKQLKSTKDKRIPFLGCVYDKPYRQILQHAFAYIHPLLADGTSPSLLQSMAAARCIMASALPETMHVIGNIPLS